ncbi:MAG: MFS transporter [Firmicutes bacterium]|nr:MFS transporter [Bacillota bacterium]
MSDLNQHNIKEYQRRWFIWGILALAYVVVFFHRVAVGVVRTELITDFSISDVEFGNLGSMYFYAYMLMQIPSGILADTLGARKTVTIGTLLAGIGSIIFSMGQSITVGYIGRLIVGLGVSVVFISTLKILSQWFKEDEFGRMSGLTSFFGNGGSLLAQFPLVLMVSYMGWRMSFTTIGIITIIIAALIFIIVRNRPEDVGLNPITLKTSTEKVSVGKSISRVFSNPRTWPGFFIFGGMFGTMISFIGAWGVPYMMHIYNVTKGKASTFTMTVTVGLMIGSLVVGIISDKIGRRKLPLIVFSIVYLLTWIILLFVNSGDMTFGFLYVLYFIMGFSCSGFVLSWACAKEVNPPDYAGISTGTVNMGGFLFAAIIQPLIGYILDHNWAGKMLEGAKVYNIDSYNKAFMLCLVGAIMAVLSVVFVKETNCKNIYNHN